MKTKHLSVILLAVIALLMASCSKDKQKEQTVVHQPKQYLITWSFSYSLKCTIFQYNESNEKIYNHTINLHLGSGTSRVFTADDNAVKVKVYLRYESGSNLGWVQQVYYLSEGDTKTIRIDGNTIIGSNEP